MHLEKSKRIVIIEFEKLFLIKLSKKYFLNEFFSLIKIGLKVFF